MLWKFVFISNDERHTNKGWNQLHTRKIQIPDPTDHITKKPISIKQYHLTVTWDIWRQFNHSGGNLLIIPPSEQVLRTKKSPRPSPITLSFRNLDTKRILTHIVWSCPRHVTSALFSHQSNINQCCSLELDQASLLIYSEGNECGLYQSIYMIHTVTYEYDTVSPNQAKSRVKAERGEQNQKLFD